MGLIEKTQHTLPHGTIPARHLADCVDLINNQNAHPTGCQPSQRPCRALGSPDESNPQLLRGATRKMLVYTERQRGNAALLKLVNDPAHHTGLAAPRNAGQQHNRWAFQFR